MEGKTLLQKVCDAAITAQLAPIIVVVGANADEIMAQHTNSPINFVVNDSWQKGMSASITAGLLAFGESDEQATNVILSVCDQPYIDTKLFNALIEKQKETNKGIVASKYNDTVGTPVLFSPRYFKDLMLLTGNEGAKKLVLANTTDLATVNFEKGNIDIDTETDYQDLLKNIK